MIGTGGDERLRELQSDAATQSQDTRVERLVASKPAGLRYGSAARHIVDETPGGRAAPAPQQAVFDRAHSVADRPLVDRPPQIQRPTSQARTLRWVVALPRRPAFQPPVAADERSDEQRVGKRGG